MKRLVIVAFGLALMIVPLANCSSGSSKDDCGDVAKKVCEKIQSCGFLGVSMNQCIATLEGAARDGNETDEQCRQEWESIEAMSCQQLLN